MRWWLIWFVFSWAVVMTVEKFLAQSPFVLLFPLTLISVATVVIWWPFTTEHHFEADGE